MEALLLALSPFVVNGLTSVTKKMRTVTLTENRKRSVRFLAVLFSTLAVILGGWVSGEAIDQNALVTLVEAGAVFIASQVTYFAHKKISKN